MKTLFCLFLLSFSLSCFSQTTDQYRGIAFAYDNYLIQGGYSYGKEWTFLSEKKSIMLAYDVQNNRKGLTASYSLGSFFCFGSDVGVLYNDKFDMFIKPKIGLGFPAVFCVFYGYNFYIGDTKSNATFSFEINIPFIRKQPPKNKNFLFGLIKDL